MSTERSEVDIIFLGLRIHYVTSLPFDICIMKLTNICNTLTDTDLLISDT